MENEIELMHSDLSFLENLEEYTFESKMFFCQMYASKIMTLYEVSTDLMLIENVMPWELEASASQMCRKSTLVCTAA